MYTLDDLSRRSGGFLSDIQAFTVPIDPTVPSGGSRSGLRLQAQFAPRVFDPALFDRLGIHRPARLDRAVDKRLAEYLAGRLLAAAAQQALGFQPQPILSAPDRAPIWPDGVVGSISHTGDQRGGHCACLMLPAGSGLPGIDIEGIASGSALDAICKVALTPTERDLIGAGPNRAFTASLCFSAKETLFKSLYPQVNRFFGFQAATLAALPIPGAQEGVLKLRLVEDLLPAFQAGTEFAVSYVTSQNHITTWRL